MSSQILGYIQQGADSQTKRTPFQHVITQVYAPMSDNSEEDLDRFYEVPENTKQFKLQEMVLVMGNFKTKVGETKAADIKGKYWLGLKTKWGERFTEQCNPYNKVITFFQHHWQHRWTLQSPQVIRNQIDYITINSRLRHSAIQVKTYLCVDCGSDHVVVMANILVKLQTLMKPNSQVQLDYRQLCKNNIIKE